MSLNRLASLIAAVSGWGSSSTPGNPRSGCHRSPHTSRWPAVLILPLFLVTVVTAGAVAQDLITEVDDDLYVPLVRPSDHYDGSVDAQLRTTMTASMPPGVVDTTRITSIDPSAFPEICTYVEVLDEQGNPIGGFDADSFCVFQDGVRIDSFSVVELHRDQCPTSICLVIDVSGSMNQEGKLTAAKNAAKAFVRQMDVLDRVAIVTFASCYSIVQTFTNDTTLLISKINALTSGGFTAALDGIWVGTDLTVPEIGSKAVIALSDGMENRSQWCDAPPDGLTDGSFADDSTLIVNLAKSGGVPIYTISLGNTFDPQYLIGLANGSGGAYYHAPTGGDIQNLYEEIKFRLCSRYLICYASPDTIPNGDCHTVQICQQNVAGACVNCDTTSYCEPDNPRITLLTDPDCVRWEQDFQVCATVIDSDTPPEGLTVKLFYRLATNVVFTELTMSHTGGNQWCATIPGADIKCDDDTIYVYLTAADDRVTVTNPAGAPTTVHKFPVCPNRPPVCQDPSDQTIVFCPGEEVCLPVGCTDPDGNLDGGPVQVFGPGNIANGYWCYEPKGSEKVLVGFVCNDSCRIKDCEADFEITFIPNEAPVCSFGGQPVPIICTPPRHVVPIVSVDPEGGEVTCTNSNPEASLVGGNWIYEPVPGETVYDTIICVDPCGNACTLLVEFTYPNPQPPICLFDGIDTSITLCQPGPDSLPILSVGADSCKIVSGPGVLRDGYWVYSPTGSQTVDLLIRCYSECDSCDGRIVIDYEINRPPVCTIPNDTSIFQCEAGPVSLPVYATDPDGNLQECRIASGPGVLANGYWTYTPSGDESVTVEIVCVDSCGAECSGTFTVDFDVNEPPVCGPQNDTTIFLCEPQQVCIPLKATDPDGNFLYCYPAGHHAARTAQDWCFYADRDTTVTALYVCVDACEAVCEDSFRVTFIINKEPVCTIPEDTTILLCEIEPVSLPLFATDVDGNLDECRIVEGPGTLANGYWTYTPEGSGPVTVTVVCEDSCGASCRGVFTVTFEISGSPSCPEIADLDTLLCEPGLVRWAFESDADTCYIVSGPGELDAGGWSYDATGPIEDTVVIRCETDCGACEDTFAVTIRLNNPPICIIPNDTTYFLCDTATICFDFFTEDPDGNMDFAFAVFQQITPTAFAVPDTFRGTFCNLFDGPGLWQLAVFIRDSCGGVCADTSYFDIQFNQPPICRLPNDTTYNLCDTATICFDFFAEDPDGNIKTGFAAFLPVIPGASAVPDTFSGTFCRLFDSPGRWVFTVYVEDSCGEICADTAYIDINFDEPPVCPQTADLDTVLCEPGHIRWPIGITGEHCDLVSGPGELIEGVWVYNATGAIDEDVIIRCENDCGFCEDTFRVTIKVNRPPVVECVLDTTGHWAVLAISGDMAPPKYFLRLDGFLDNNPAHEVTFAPDPKVWLVESGSEMHIYGTMRIVEFDNSPVGGGPYDQRWSLSAWFDRIYDGSGIVDYNPDWRYYKLRPQAGPEMVNLDDPNDVAYLWDYPFDDSKPFRIGYGGNGKNANFGASGWLTFVHDDNGTVYGDSTVHYAASDFLMDLMPCVVLCAPGTGTTSYTAFDPDGDPLTEWSNIGTASGGTVEFPADTTGIYTIIINVEDPCGERDADTCIVCVDINLPPVITCGPDLEFDCEFVGEFRDPDAYDPEGGPLVISYDQDSIPGQCPFAYTLVRTWIATDSCGAADSCQQRLHVFDNTPPVVICREGEIPECPPVYESESCEEGVTVGHFTMVFDSVIYDNIFGRSAWYYHLTWNGTSPDLSHLTIGVCGDLTEDDLLTSSPPADEFGRDGSTGLYGIKWEFSDNFPANTPVPFSFVLDGLWEVGPVSFAAKAGRNDNIGSICGPSLECEECDERDPTPPPVISCDDPLAINPPLAVDNCDPEPLVRRVATDSIPGNCPYSYTLTVTWEAIDACGNADTCTQTYAVVDTTAPVVTCPPDTTIECGDLQAEFGWATAVDNCDPHPRVDLVATDTLAQQGQCYIEIRRFFAAVDACGNWSDTCYQTITVGDTTAPVCNVPEDTAIFVCFPGEEICLPVSVTDNCDEDVECIAVVSSGKLPDDITDEIVDGYWCWTASTTDELRVTVTCTDDCGNTCTSVFIVAITVNEPPVCETPNDTTIALCQPGLICIPLKGSDPDGNLIGCLPFEPGEESRASGEPDGQDEWCFFAERDTTITVHFRCWDECEAYCEDSFRVTIQVGSDPVCDVPNDTTIFLCEPETICLPFGGTATDGGAVRCWVVGDEENDLRTEGGFEWCYFADRDTTLDVVIRCENECGSCEDTFRVTINLNSPPIVIKLPDQAFELCGPDTICIGPWPKIDEDDNWMRNFAPFGFLKSPFLCFVPDTAGVYTLILCIEDSCGAVACDTVEVKVTYNQPPVCELPNDTTIFLCEPERVCLPIYSSDPDGDLTTCRTFIGSPDARVLGCAGDCPKDLWCYTPQQSETVTVYVICSDTCGNYCDGEFTVTFILNEPPACDLPNDTSIFLCEPGKIALPISVTDPDGNLKTCRVVEGGGSIVDGYWTYTAEEAETLTVVIACEDSCGAECRGVFKVEIEMNLPPTCLFNEPQPPVCVPPLLVVPILSEDPEGGEVTCEVVEGPGEMNEQVWSWEPIPGTIDTVVIRCTDECGAYCEISFVVNVPNPQPPTCVVPVENQSFFLCQPGQVEVDVYAVGGSGGDITCEVIEGPGTIVGDKWIYSAAQSTFFEVTVRCTDICGAFCEATFRVDIIINSPPVCELPKDQQIFQCNPEKILLPIGVTDIDGNFDRCVVTSGPGSIVDGYWNFTPTGPGDYSVTIACYDSCEAVCQGTFRVQVRIDEPPVCRVPNDTTIRQCSPTQVALPVSATFYVPDFSGGDDRDRGAVRLPRGNVSKRDQEARGRVNQRMAAGGGLELCEVVSGPGFISNGYWYYTPSGDETVTVTVRCTDECGKYCEATFRVTFEINDPPVCSFQAPGPSQCTPPVIVVPFTSTDPEGGPLTCEIISGPGEIGDGVWQYVPSPGESFAVKIRCTDTCGAYCDIDFNINVPNPQPPVCVIPTSTVNRFLCGPGEVRVPVTSSGGTGGTSCQVIDGPGTIIGGEWVFNAPSPGLYTVTVECTDACGETCRGTFNVNVTFNSAPVCTVPANQTVRGCNSATVSLPVSATDVDGNLTGCAVVGGPGQIVGGNWTYTATSSGTVNVTIRCTDACGAYCEKTFSVTFDLNDPPVCNLESQYFFQGCDQVNISIPISATDPDGNLRRCVKKTGVGNIVNGNWVYTATTSGVFNVQIECTDSCGAATLCGFSVIVDLNDPPVCNFRDTTIVVCGPGDISVPLPSFDPDGNLAGCVLLSGPGSIVGHEWFWHLQEDLPVNLVIKCVDACGMECIGTWRINFEFGDERLCDFEMPTTVYLCGPGEFCFDIPPGCEIEVGMAKVDGVTMCFEATEEGTYWADIACYDDCGGSCTRRAYFEVIFTDLPDCGPSIVSGRPTGEGGATPQAADAEPCNCPSRGDISGDGRITSLDLGILYGVLNGHPFPAHYRQDARCPVDARADFNCDGKVDMQDALALTQYIFHQGTPPCARCTEVKPDDGAPRDR